MRTAKQCDRYAVKSLVSYYVNGLIRYARTFHHRRRKDVQRSAQPGKRACYHHGKNDVALAVHACILCSVLVEAGCAKLVAEGRLHKNYKQDHCQRYCNDGTDIKVGIAGRQRWKLGGLGKVLSPRFDSYVHCGVVADYVVHHIHADVVEHDGGYDLVDIQ